MLDDTGDGPRIVGREGDVLLTIPGDIASERAAEIEEEMWRRMSFARRLRARRLGEFTSGTDLLRSESLALVQLLVLYHLVWARATVANGGAPPRIEVGLPTGADSALHA